AHSRGPLGFVAANLVFGITQPNVDVAAHLGGFIAGVFLGGALALPLVAGINAKRLRRSALVAATGTAVAAVAFASLPVVDDWPTELKRVATLESYATTRLSELTSQLQSSRIDPVEFAAHVHAEVLPPLIRQRSTILSLRLRQPQRMQAEEFAEYLSLRVEALKRIADGVQSNDTAAVLEGNAKEEAALEKLQTIAP